MFGKDKPSDSPTNRPAVSQVAQIQTHLTQIIAEDASITGIHLFIDGKSYDPTTIESLSVDIVAPSETDPVGRMVGQLSVYETDTNGQKRQKGISLFPGVVDFLIQGRRLSIACPEASAFEGLWLGFGMYPDGTAESANGVISLSVTLIGGQFSSSLTWAEDGKTEEIFPAG
jgi:hypothetical protein